MPAYPRMSTPPQPAHASVRAMVRPGIDADAECIASFNCAMAWETERREIPPELMIAGVRNLLDNPRYGFYAVAEAPRTDGTPEIAGCLLITYEWSDWRNGLFWWVQSVYVAPAHRRRGVYRALYDWVRERARASGECCGFRLYVEKDNGRAQRTYESLGMHRCDYLMYEESFTRETGEHR